MNKYYVIDRTESFYGYWNITEVDIKKNIIIPNLSGIISVTANKKEIDRLLEYAQKNDITVIMFEMVV